MTRLELAHCLSATGKQDYASMILSSTDKRMKAYSSPVLAKRFCDSLSEVCMNQGRFQEALSYEKKATELKPI